jgi:hypothetical protein
MVAPTQRAKQTISKRQKGVEMAESLKAGPEPP